MFKEVNDEHILSCCFTGHRPNKLPFNVYKKDKAYIEFENYLISEILKILNEGCRIFYSGMAMGFDIIAAETVLLLKNVYKYPVKLVCAVPFKEQGKLFSNHWQERYNHILEQCDEIVVVSESYYKGCYQKRNRFMVDNCDYVLTWYDGKAGGTKNTIDYALKKNRYIINLNENCLKDFSLQTTFELF